MFSEKAIGHIEGEMSIVLVSIERKLTECVIKSNQNDLIEFIEELVCLSKKGASAKQEINDKASDLCAKAKNSSVISVIDTLRHAFVLFACGGLHLLYTRQENEDWYPKIELTEILEPHDIGVLSDPVVIYRGCDISEFNSQQYGQSWSTSMEIAEVFAYSHYSGQPWFKKTDRVVLKTTYPKAKVLFSDQSGEKEVVVRSACLINVEKCT